MSDHIYISAVIPTYNREHTIARAIDSVLGQEYAPAEIIVVDDGSSDNTRKIIEAYGEKIRYVYQTNGGVSAARNRGVSEAKHEWIAFLDSDDYWLPLHLRRIVNAIEATRGEAALYFSDTQRDSDEGEYFHWDLCEFEITGPFEFNRDAGKWALMRTQPMMIQTSVIRRTAYLEIGGLPEKLRTREDTLLFLKLNLLYPACAVSGCGGIMTPDGDVRLTQVYGGKTLIYWQSSIFLYREVLASIKTVSSERRKALRDFLSASYFSMGRLCFRRKKYLRSIRNLSISGFISPSVFVKMLSASVDKHIIKKGTRIFKFPAKDTHL